jgi:outer membrane protein OmpA-like peptidoglycan-associated protein
MRWRRSGILAVVCIASLALGCASNGSTTTASTPAESPATTAGLGVGSVLASALYAPVKIVYATAGAIVGGVAWIFTGGDSDTAMSIFQPSMAGDYVITPDHLRDPGSIEFIGERYEAATANLAAVSAPPPTGAGSCTGSSLVRFAWNEATLAAPARSDLDQMARELGRCPEQRLRIEGHADATGESEHNQELSQRRAVAVKDYLEERGVARSRISAAGLGTSNPVSTNATREGRAANRRAEIALLSR